MSISMSPIPSRSHALWRSLLSFKPLISLKTCRIASFFACHLTTTIFGRFVRIKNLRGLMQLLYWVGGLAHAASSVSNLVMSCFQGETQQDSRLLARIICLVFVLPVASKFTSYLVQQQQRWNLRLILLVYAYSTSKSPGKTTAPGCQYIISFRAYVLASIIGCPYIISFRGPT